MSLVPRFIHAVAASGFRGSYVMASQMARFAGRTRWARVSLGGKVEVVLDLAIPKYWPLVLGRFEEGVSRFFVSALHQGHVVYDVGANWGFYSLLSAALVGDAGKVEAFEPGEASLMELREHIAHGGLSNIQVNHCAVSERSGEFVWLDVPAFPHSDTGSHLTMGRSRSAHQVQTLSLDDCWKQQGYPHVRLLKIDVEGAELLALRGAEELLRQAHCDYVVMETGIFAKRFGASARDSVSLLHSHGYVHQYRFLDKPPYLAPLLQDEWEDLNDCICASTTTIPEDLVKAMASLEREKLLAARDGAGDPH